MSPSSSIYGTIHKFVNIRIILNLINDGDEIGPINNETRNAVVIYMTMELQDRKPHILNGHFAFKVKILNQPRKLSIEINKRI